MFSPVHGTRVPIILYTPLVFLSSVHACFFGVEVGNVYVKGVSMLAYLK